MSADADSMDAVSPFSHHPHALRTFEVAGNALDADTLRGQFGGVADSILQTRSLCIADQLPAGLTLTSATVQGQDVVATFDIAGGIVNDPALQADGSCG